MALISPTFFAAAEVARNFPAFDQLYDALKCTMRKYSATDSIVQPVRTQIHVPDTSARFQHLFFKYIFNTKYINIYALLYLSI